MELQEGEDKLRSNIVRVSDLTFFCLIISLLPFSWVATAICSNIQPIIIEIDMLQYEILVLDNI